MTRHGLWAIGVVAILCVAGCGKPLGFESSTEMTIQEVSYADTFATAKEVMRKHFEIDSADPDTGVIIAKPQHVDAPAERLLGGKSSARHLAKMQIQQKNGQVITRVKVELQRQGATSYQHVLRPDDYSTVPNQTPAQETAATTAEQNESWETESRDYALERKILDELKQVLQPSK